MPMDSKDAVQACWVALQWFALFCWTVVAPFVHLAQYVFVGLPIQFIEVRVRKHPTELAAGCITGLALSYGLFLPINQARGLSPGTLCTSYLTAVAWVMGQLCMRMMISAGLTFRLGVQWSCCREGLDQVCPVRSQPLTDAMYVGVALGLAFASSVTIQQQDGEDSVHWCVLPSGLPSELVYIPFWLLSLVGANASIRRERRIQVREEQVFSPEYGVASEVALELETPSATEQQQQREQQAPRQQEDDEESTSAHTSLIHPHTVVDVTDESENLP